MSLERCDVCDVASAEEILRIMLDEARAFRKAFRASRDVKEFLAL